MKNAKAAFSKVNLVESSNHKEKIILAIILLISFIGVFVTGTRGFYSFDQSIPLDGANRILHGQVPFTDFDIPYGLTMFYIQSFFSIIFSLNFISTVISAAFLNVLFVYLVFKILKLIEIDDIYVYLGSLVSAFVYNIVIGSIWVDNVGFLFCTLSTYFLLKGYLKGKDKNSMNLNYFLSGLALAAIFFSKQNLFIVYFVFCILLFMALLIIEKKTEELVCFAKSYFIGAFVCFIAILLALYFFTDFKAFLTDYIMVPFFEGGNRIGNVIKSFLDFTPAQVIINLINISIFIVVIVSAFMIYLKKGLKDEKTNAGLFLILSCGLTQLAHFELSNNNINILIMYLGIIYALSGDIIEGSINIFSRNIRKIALIAAGFMLIVLVFYSGYIRFGSDIFRGDVKFNEHLASTNVFRFTYWANPTLGDSTEVYNGIYALISEDIQKNNDRFYVYPESTVFYIHAKTLNPSRIVWFHKGLTFPSNSTSTDLNLVSDLKKNDVKWIILETQVPGYKKRIESFSNFINYINSDFELYKKIGGFEIYKIKEVN
jgi:4-amino-4-deoxy-L-arabinose transferase-like glycosyltransferase